MVYTRPEILKKKKKNCNEKFFEVKALFNIWLKRLITPLGRVAILKSLILSKLVHLWILLPNPPDDFVNNLQKMCFKFIWNNKQDKISCKSAGKSVKSEWRLGSTRYKEIYFSPGDYVDKKTETDKAQMEKHSISNLSFYYTFRTMWSKFV